MSTWVGFRFQAEKSVNGVAYLAERCPSATRLKICKLLYFADRDHLRRFGRPIVDDHYYRLPHGPIPARGLDILRGQGSTASQALFDRHVSVIRNAVHPKQRPNLKVFSKSDLDVLKATCKRYGTMGAGQLRTLSHADRAWLEAPENGPMDYALFFEDSVEGQRIRELVEAEQEGRDVVRPFNFAR